MEVDGDLSLRLLPMSVVRASTRSFAEDARIGHGGSGKVYRCELVLGGVMTPVAVKRLNQAASDILPELQRSAELRPSPFILPVLAAVRQRIQICILFID